MQFCPEDDLKLLFVFSPYIQIGSISKEIKLYLRNYYVLI